MSIDAFKRRGSRIISLTEKLNKVKSLVDDLYFDYDRLSSSGQETLDKIEGVLSE